MKLIIFGASGRLGTRLISEALLRGHEITAVARDPLQGSLDPLDQEAMEWLGFVLDWNFDASDRSYSTAVNQAISTLIEPGDDWYTWEALDSCKDNGYLHSLPSSSHN